MTIMNDIIDEIEEILGENEGDFFNPTEVEWLYESNHLPANPPGVIYGVKNGWGGMEPYTYSYVPIPCETDRQKRERAYTEDYWLSMVAYRDRRAAYLFAVPHTHCAWIA